MYPMMGKDGKTFFPPYMTPGEKEKLKDKTDEDPEYLFCACRKMTKENSYPELLEKFRELAKSAKDSASLLQIAKDYLHKNPDSKFLLTDDRCQKKFGAIIYKPAQGYKEYRRVLKYFAAESLMEYVLKNNRESLCQTDFSEIEKIPLYNDEQVKRFYCNAGKPGGFCAK